MTYSTELHRLQIHDTYSLQTTHAEMGVKHPPHPLQDPLSYIPCQPITIELTLNLPVLLPRNSEIDKCYL